MRIMAKPTLASNFNGGISSEDFYMQGIAVIHRTIRKGFRIGAGVTYTNGFGKPLLLPVLNLRYQTENFDLNLTAPFQVSAKYRTGNLMVGFNSGVEGNQYNLHLEENDRPFAEKADAINFSRFNIGPVFGWYIPGQGRIEVSAGMSLNRVFKVVDREDQETDLDLDNGFFIRTGFYFGR